MREQTNKLFIIGNGFDLHHGLRTSYANFRDDYVKNQPHFWRRLCEVYGGELKKDMWWWNFEEMLGMIDYEHLITSINGEALGSQKIKNLLGNEIPNAFGDWIEKVEKAVNPMKSLPIDSEALFFTFNYTMVIEKVYGIKQEQIWHIHNSLADYRHGDNPIVGHDSNNGQMVKRFSEYRVDHPNIRTDIFSMINDEAVKRAKKVKERIQEQEERFYDLYSGIKHFIAMGFSFNEIDMPYINEIIKVNANIQDADWKVYWHSDDEGGIIQEKLQSLGIMKDRITLVNW